jgi:hypothetical protein
LHTVEFNTRSLPMSLITEFYEKLVKFSDLEEVSTLINDLNELGIDNDELIAKCRKQLQSLTSQTTIKKDESTLAEVSHMGLLALAEFKPLNDVDPFTRDTIEDEDKVFTSSGHQFSLSSLLFWHEGRDYRGSGLGEQYNSKWLLNPITNDRFDLMDVAHIQAVALQKGIEIADLRLSGPLPQVPLAFSMFSAGAGAGADAAGADADAAGADADAAGADADAAGADASFNLPAGITHIDLSNNNLSSISADQLAVIFAALPAHISSLNLGSNDYGFFNGGQPAVASGGSVDEDIYDDSPASEGPADEDEDNYSL